MNRPSPPTLNAKSVLGVPFLPPGAITGISNRAREAVGHLHARMAPPPVRILEGIFGVLDHRVLVVLCAAGVPDALTGKTNPAALASKIGVDPVALERLLRFAAARGWVRIDRRGRVRPTAVTAFLRRDHPGGWRAWVEFAGGDEIVASIASLSIGARPVDAFAAANGIPFFDWMARHPDRWTAFDNAMAAGGRMHALTLDAALDWSAANRVCDVGGGTGQLLASLLELQPHLEGVLFDLPDVVARAVQHARLTAIGGDAFREVPKGFDTYLLVNVLHDWNDDDAGKILECVAQAALPDARIIVVDNERTVTPRNDLAVSADVLMAALTNGGRGRTTSEFAALGKPCGLRLARTVRLASGDVAHEFVTSRR
jgi:SAM-dependent methyltransferase